MSETRRCPVASCHAPELSCSIGNSNLRDCNHWMSAQEPQADEVNQNEQPLNSTELRFPWTGNAMGVSDLPYLAGSAATRLITMVGAADAGKTSLLAAFYLLIGRGITPNNVTFAGSLSLEGWENIASSLRWSSKNGPRFPAHTSSGSGRRPGMLHLSLQVGSKRQELLAADAPGEWFSDWATSRDAPQAEGACWLSECSDVFLVIADSKALSGDSRGLARRALIDLLRRVGAEIRGRPVALVWTKSDIALPSGMQETIQEAAQRSLKDYVEFRVSLLPPDGTKTQDRGQGIIELMSWVLSASAKKYEAQEIKAPERQLLRIFGGI